MRRGNTPSLITGKNGELIAISTGSDACAEHECGSAPLLAALSGHAVQTKRDLAQLIRLRGLAAMPSLVQMRRITQQLDRFEFVEGESMNEPTAAIGFKVTGRSAGSVSLLDHSELRRFGKDPVQGAWSDNQFALRVSGEPLVAKLRRFAQGIKDGQGIFAGLFMQDGSRTGPAGVCVALEPLLSDEHREAMKRAQVEFEEGVRLEVQSRASELMNLYRMAHPAGNLGHVWASWKDRVPDTEVVYLVNPPARLKVSQGMTFEEFTAWIARSKRAA